MATPSPWPMIHAERAALADDLRSLTSTQWATRSLCTEWTVQEVLGHLSATAKMTQARFFRKLAGSRFQFDAMSAKLVARETAGSPADTLAEFREHLNDSTSPPGPVEAMLGEVVIHGADIRRPLAIAHRYPPDALVRVADFFRGSNLLIGAKRRISGVTLRATDADWSSGSGAEVTGPILSLILVMTGRSAALTDLAGEGVATLSARV